MQPAVVPYTTEVEHDGRTYTVTVPELKAFRCERCKELVLDSAANRQITQALREQLRLVTPEQIRENREALGLTQRQLATHLGIAEATLSRWETGGQIQQRALNRLLRLYFGIASVRDALADEERLAELGTSARCPPEPEKEHQSSSTPTPAPPVPAGPWRRLQETDELRKREEEFQRWLKAGQQPAQEEQRLSGGGQRE